MRFLLPVLLAFTLLGCSKDEPVDVPAAKHLHLEAYVTDLHIPWGMGFLPNGDFIFCERNGKISLRKKNSKDHFLITTRTVQESEGGLLGLVVDPDFESNHYIFLYETVVGYNQLVRMKMLNDVLFQDQVILTGIPASNNHDGGALRFGPDGFLYLGTGDAQQPPLAQDTSSLAGKILRLDRNGNAAPGNPFNNRVWTYGHRNVQGFDWDKGKMIETEHGPTSEFGWCCHDEINLIVAGRNYGWPITYAGMETDSLTPALYQTNFEVWAPSGCTFIHGSEWGDWNGDFIFGALKGERLVRFDMSAAGDSVTVRHDTLVGTFQRLRNIIQAPDGSLLFSSSNVASTGITPAPGDDKIYRLFWQ